MKKRKYMESPSGDHYTQWDKHCVFSVQKNPGTDERCLGCPFLEEFSGQARPQCMERNVRFLLVKRWVTTVVSAAKISVLGIWASNYLTEDQLEELMWKGEFEFVRHDHEHWHFYRLHKLAIVAKGLRGDYW